MVSEKAVRDLKKALKNKVTDRFKTGDVIRWKAAGFYSYAAIKTPVGWYTTASNRAAAYVGQVVSFDKLLEILNRSETTDIQVATEWEDI
jgi:hypothetical protein